MIELKTRILPPRIGRGLTSHGIVIIADLTESVVGFRAGSIVYLATPHQHNAETVGAIIRSNAGQLQTLDLPWHLVRCPRFRSVPSHIADHCWQPRDKDDGEQILGNVIQHCLPPIEDFAPDIGNL